MWHWWLTGILFSLTMLMVSVALVMAVIVTNIFLRKDSGKRVPSSVRRVFLHRRHTPPRGHQRLPSPPSHTSAWTPASFFTAVTHLIVDASVFLHRRHTPPRGRQRLPSPPSYTSSWTPASSFAAITHLLVDASVFLHRRHTPPRGLSTKRESVTSMAAPAIISPTTVVGAARNHDSAAVKYRDTLDLDSLSILSELEQQNSTSGVVVRQNSRRGYAASTRRCSPSVVTNSRRSRATSMQHADALTTDTNELYSREWQMLAKVVDRIFFWLFVFSSIGALGSMFASLPHKNLS